MEKDCLFCKIINGEIPCYKIYEDEDFLAFLDIHPVNLGHTLILSKQHYRNLFNLPAELLPKLGPILQKLGQAVKTGTNADGLNIGWNNESAAGQIIFHSHIHLIPRFETDGLKSWPSREIPTEDSLLQWQESIRAKL